MFRLFSLTIVGLVLIYAIESAVLQKFITGKVTHKGQNNIDKNFKVQVELRDVSLMDVASKLIGSTVISDAKTFPVSYRLGYNPSDIKPGHTYSMSARITGPGDKLQYVNDVRIPAELTGTTSPAIDIPVIRVEGSPDTSVTGTGGKKACGPVNCRGKTKACPYGYQKKDGCDICKCNDPCNPPGKPILCGPKQRCFIDKKLDGTFGTRCDTASATKGKGKGKDGKKDSKVDCSQPKITGLCRAAFPRFYYNSATKSCEAFTYGGCGGNGNNFETKIACEKACKA